MTYYEDDFAALCAEYDVVVMMFYVQNLSFIRRALSNSFTTKYIFWGIGVRASQKHEFDSPTFINHFRYFLASKADAMIFYTDYARNKYISKSLPSEKLFVMPNTVFVRDMDLSAYEKKHLLFVGTLNKSKKIFELLDCYDQAKAKNPNLPKLEIVGGGVDHEGVKEWVAEKGYSDQIMVHGPIYDEETLSELFVGALACISPGQAGLSVLKSFGYGVPFITTKNAVTGGERLNIDDGKNGLLYGDSADLEGIILDIAVNREKYIEMGSNARSFYMQERSPENMAKGFIDAVSYVLSKAEK